LPLPPNQHLPSKSLAYVAIVDLQYLHLDLMELVDLGLIGLKHFVFVLFLSSHLMRVMNPWKIDGTLEINRLRAIGPFA
jgi:hypothetical protein